MRIFVNSTALLALAIAFGPAAAQTGSFEDGLSAYEAAVASQDESHQGFKRAFEIWEPLAEQGHPGAAYHVGLYYYLGAGGLVFDQPRGINFVQQAAADGYATAQAFLGLMSEKGDGIAVRRSQEDSLMWYLRAALGGQCAGVKRIAIAYENGELGLAADADRAAHWQERVEGCIRR